MGCGSDFPSGSPLIPVISLRRMSQFGFRVGTFTSLMFAYLLEVRGSQAQNFSCYNSVALKCDIIAFLVVYFSYSQPQTFYLKNFLNLWEEERSTQRAP